MRTGYFFIPALIFISNFYLYNWFVRLTSPGRKVRGSVLAGMLILLTLFPVSRLWASHDFNSANRLLTFLSASWGGISFLLVLFAAGTDLARFFLRLAGVSPNLPLSRILYWRRVLAAASVAACLGLAGYAFWEAAEVRVTRVEIPLRHLPRELDGMTVAHLSDVHYGLLHENGRLGEVVGLVNELKPDLVVFTGDLVDSAVSHLEEMEAPLSRLQAPHGVFAVVGNHEVFAGVERVERILKRAGVRVLRNEIKVLAGGIQLLGIDDPRVASRGLPLPDFNGLLRTLDPAKPSLLLYHQPLRFEEAAAAGVGLQLSGHIHGPQLRPMVPLVRLFYQRMQGLFKLGESYLYVSRGVGTGGPPMRLGSPPEIALVRLRSMQ